MRLVMKTYKYKLYNNKKNKYLVQQIEIASEIWNFCIAMRRMYYLVYGKTLKANDLKKYERPFWEADATAFVRAMYDEMQSHDKSFSWFHQCGSGQEQNGNYYGYQFFEVCSKTEESDAKRMAEIIAEKIGTNVV